MDISISQESLNAIFNAGIITVVFLLAFIFINWSFPKFQEKFGSFSQKYIPSLKIRNFEIISSKSLSQKCMTFIGILRIGIYLLGLYFYLSLVLGLFPQTHDLSENMLEYITTPLKEVFATIVSYIPKAIYLIIIFLVMKWVLKIIKAFFERIEYGQLHFEGFHKEWASPTYKLIRILVFVFTIIIAFPHLPGASSPAFQGVSVFLGLLISLGSSSAISNLTAGLVITYMRPFQVGDRIRLGTTFGDVVEKNLLVTRLRTIHNVDITIPNSSILNNHILNYSTLAHSEGVMVNAKFKLGFKHEWSFIHQLMNEAAKITTDVWLDKKTIIYQTVVDQNYVEYELNVFTREALKTHIIASDLNRNVLDIFHKHGIEVANPTLVSLRSAPDMELPFEGENK